MSEDYLDIEEKMNEISELVELNWENLSEEDVKEIEFSNSSMYFFNRMNEVERFYYEANNVIKILKQATEF